MTLSAGNGKDARAELSIADAGLKYALTIIAQDVAACSHSGMMDPISILPFRLRDQGLVRFVNGKRVSS